MRVVELYVTGLGPTYVGIRTEGRGLDSVNNSTRTGVAQSVQQSVF